MADDSDPRRDAVDAFLRGQGPIDIDSPATLTGWVIVSEWMDDDGDRWLSRGWAASKAKWEVDGMLHEVLYGNWPTDD